MPIGKETVDGDWMDGDVVDKVSSGSERQVDALRETRERAREWAAEARGERARVWLTWMGLEEAVGPVVGRGTEGMLQQAWRT